jgi:hypothetical protein
MDQENVKEMDGRRSFYFVSVADRFGEGKYIF